MSRAAEIAHAPTGLLVVAAAAAVAMAAVVAADRLLPADRTALEASAAVVALGGVVLAADDAAWLAHALTVAGIACGAIAVRVDRRAARTPSAVLLVLSSAVRWVSAPDGPIEAYVVPPAIALLLLGALSRRRTAAGSRAPSSWQAYGPGLTVGLLPSLAAALEDDGLARPLLLGLAALAAVLVGARLRLQAPLVMGAAVLAVDALAQVAPYAAALPRWVSIGAAGLLLLGVGATYEDRIENARTVRRRYAALR
jgi:hypothetical protein